MNQNLMYETSSTFAFLLLNDTSLEGSVFIFHYLSELTATDCLPYRRRLSPDSRIVRLWQADLVINDGTVNAYRNADV